MSPDSLAAALVLLDLLRLQGDSALGRGSRRLSLHSCLDLRSHGQESLFDVGRGLGGCFQKFDSERVREFLSLFGGNDALGGEIGLVTDEELVDVFGRVTVDFVQPLLDVVEGLLVGDVVDHNDAVGAAVVAGSDGAEALLSSRVPDLELDGFAVEFNGADFLCVCVRRK